MRHTRNTGTLLDPNQTQWYDHGEGDSAPDLMRHTDSYLLLAVRFLLLAVCLKASGADLVIDPLVIQNGTGGITSVHLSTGGSRVAALQFDLDSSPVFVQGSSVTAMADGAGKTLYSANLGLGRTRFLLTGSNTNILSDGAAVHVSVAVDPAALPGTYPIQFRNAIASDPEGLPVDLNGTDGNVTVSGGGSALTLSGMFAQLAAGGGWKTTFTLMNVSSAESPARLAFRDDNGNPLSLPLAFPSNPKLSATTASAIDLTIPANGVIVVEAGAPEQIPVHSGWTQLMAPSGVSGWATFGQVFGAAYAFEAVVPADTRMAPALVLTFDNSNGYSTGIAVASASETNSANIALVFRDTDGRQVFVDTLLLPALGHRSFSLKDKYPALSGTTGSVEVQNLTGGAISVLGLRFSPSGSVTSIPPVLK